jgi:hypothetical protein
LTDETRYRLKTNWGPEVLLKCCRFWKSHGWQWGKCGECRKRPVLVPNGKWEDADG